MAVDAEAAPANVTAMTPRLASKAPSLLKFLMMPMKVPSSGGDHGRPPGSLRCLQCDGMAAGPRPGSGAITQICVLRSLDLRFGYLHCAGQPEPSRV